MEEYARDRDVSELQTKLKLSQKEYENLKTDLEIAQIQLQEANDTLNGGITPRNMANFRNTYVINASDSLDDTYPMYVYFRVLDETVKIVSVKVSYWIHNYRAYSKATANAAETSSGASGSASGGGSTSGSGGGQTSGALTEIEADVCGYDGSGFVKITETGHALLRADSFAIIHNHTHTIANHTHTTPAHTHPNHTHTIPAHNHDITYGIYEEDTTPTIKFSVSQDNGVAYSKEYGNVPIDRELIDITSDITKTGSKILKFESTTRARLTVQVEVKVDISVR